VIITKTQRRAPRYQTREHIRQWGSALLNIHRTPQHIYAKVTEPLGATGDRGQLDRPPYSKRSRKASKVPGNVEAAKAMGRVIEVADHGRWVSKAR